MNTPVWKTRAETAKYLGVTEELINKVIKLSDKKLIKNSSDFLLNPDMVQDEIVRYMRLNKEPEQIFADYSLATADGVDAFLRDLPMIAGILKENDQNHYWSYCAVLYSVIACNLVRGEKIWFPFGTIEKKHRPNRKLYNRGTRETMELQERADLYLNRNLGIIREMFKQQGETDGSEGITG